MRTKCEQESFESGAFLKIQRTLCHLPLLYIRFDTKVLTALATFY